MTHLLFFTLLTACSHKSTSQTSPPTAVENENHCPDGVKTGCNVPEVTESQLQDNQQQIDTCIDTCIQSKQTEARSIDSITLDCQSSCFEQHFIGQVQIVPHLETTSE